MTKTITRSLMGIAVLMAFAGIATPARADDGYCREYTRTVTIGGRVQDAYGTACLQSDGSWMIVGEGLGNDIPDNVSDVQYVVHDENRSIIPSRVVYYSQPPILYRTHPLSPVFVWSHNGFYRGNHYVQYRQPRSNGYNNHGRNYSWNDHDGHDRGHH